MQDRKVKRGLLAAVVLLVVSAILVFAGLMVVGRLGPTPRPADRADSEETVRLVTRETTLGPLPNVLFDFVLVSPNARRIAYAHRSRMFVNGVAQERYDSILKPWFFSPDGERLIFRARQGTEILHIADRKVLFALPSASATGFTYSPDGKHFACARDVDGAYAVFLDGKPLARHNFGGKLTFSPDGSRLAYMAYVGDEPSYAVVIDDERGPLFDEIRGITFSPDSRHLVYFGCRDDKWYAVLDGAESAAYYNVDHEPVFSPDSRRLAYLARHDYDEYLLVVRRPKDATPREAIVSGPSRFPITQPVFSPDGARMAYTSMDGLVVEGAEPLDIDKYSTIYGLTFSPDSRRVAFRTMRHKDGKQIVVVDGVDGPPYEWVKSDPIFSPDSQSVAYVAGSTEEGFVVRDGREHSRYRTLHTAVPASGRGQRAPFLTFSPDSRHLAYTARKKDTGRWVLVVDGVEGKEYDKDFFYAGSRTVFDNADSLHIIALRDGQIILAETKIVKAWKLRRKNATDGAAGRQAN